MAETGDPTTFIRSAMPLCDTLDISADAIAPEEVVLAMPRPRSGTTAAWWRR